MRRLLVFLCCSSALCLAQLPNSTPTAPTVLTQAQSAFSGGKSVTTVQMNGSASWHYGSDEQTGTVTLIASANGATSVTLGLSGGTRKESFAAWDQNPTCDWTDTDGKNHTNPTHNCLTPSTWFLPSISLQTTLPSTAVAGYVGQESTDAGVVHHVRQQRSIVNATPAAKLWMQKWSTSELMLSAQTLLPAVLKFSIHPDNDAKLDIPVEIHYSDYRLTSGVQLPFKIQKFINNNLVLEIDVDSATVN